MNLKITAYYIDRPFKTYEVVCFMTDQINLQNVLRSPPKALESETRFCRLRLKEGCSQTEGRGHQQEKPRAAAMAA